MSRGVFWILVPVAATVAAIAISCGGSSVNNEFGDGGSGDGTVFGDDGSMHFGGQDSAPPPCVGLQCTSQTDNCSGVGKPNTAISGVVYDPAGALPLYDVYVYVPNTKPDPIQPGNPTCTVCEAPASGSPVIGTLTNAQGAFMLQQGSTDPYGVPSGDNIPLVIQVGKWRKQIVIPHVTACTTTQIPNPATPSQKLRLPANGSEGDMPLMAFTSGCDPAECFLRHIGISDSEFVPPNSTSGHVHFYTANDSQGGGGTASSVTGGNTTADTYAWWTSAANLLKYDIIFNACECMPFDRGAGAYQAMHDYVSSGGRLFTTHYYYNWFAPPTGPADFQSVVNWMPGGIGGIGGPYFIDTTFPKGKSFADWLQNNGITTSYGQISLVDTRNDMGTIKMGGTRWIYAGQSSTDPNYQTMYMSFNAPTTVPVAMQCGRAVFSDVHLSGSSDDSVFPNECANADPGGAHATNEKALEFLFFDLSSCVQDNSKPPPPPTPK